VTPLDRASLKGHIDSSTGHRYVSVDDGRYRVYIRAGDKRASRRFIELEDAVEWRDQKLREFGMLKGGE
jgi:hypothetical protein